MLEYEYGLGEIAVDTALVQESAQHSTTTEKETQDLFREIGIQSQLLCSHSEGSQKTNVSVSEMPEKYVDFYDSQNSHEPEKVIIHDSPVNDSVQTGPSSALTNITEQTPVKQVKLDYSEFCAQSNSDLRSCDLTEIDHNTINFRRGNPAEKQIICPNFDIKEQIKLTCLKASIARQHLCNTLVVVLQVNPSKSVQIKNGPNGGQFLTIASILVGDESLFYVKVTLWNKTCDWIKLLSIGDVIILENIASHKYHNERSLQTNGQSQLYNFHDGRKDYLQTGKLKILVCFENTALIILYLENVCDAKSW